MARIDQSRNCFRISESGNHRRVRPPGINWLALVLITCMVAPALGQQCPQSGNNSTSTPSRVRTLEGKLIFHNGIRKWFELQLDQPQCGQASVQLTEAGKDWTSLQILRGCRVRSTGTIDFSPTGYYSLDLFQSVERIQSINPCTKQPPFPDFSGVKPDQAIRTYRVDMYLNYGTEDHPIIFSVSSAGKELKPWQAYANYWLTGGFVLYGLCGNGFVVDKVFGPPQTNPSHFTRAGDSGDRAMYDPENAAAKGLTRLHLAYTCMREQ